MMTLQETVYARVDCLTAIIAKVAYVHGVRNAVSVRAKIVEMIMSQPVITNEQIEDFMCEEDCNGPEEVSGGDASTEA